MTDESSAVSNLMTQEEWERADDDDRLAYILDGGLISLEQAQEFLTQIAEDLAYEERYLVTQISAETLIAEELKPFLTTNTTQGTPVLEVQNSSLLPIESVWQATADSISDQELVRLQRRRLNEIRLIQQALWRKLEELTEQQQRIEKLPRHSLPKNLPQQTCREIRNAAIAVADGPTLRRWNIVEGETALTHKIPGETLHTRLTAGPGLDWWGLPATYHSLREELAKLELPAVLLLNILIGAALYESHPSGSLDEMIKRIGWDPRTVSERAGLRRKVWRWLLLFDSLTVHGKRPGRYRDRLTNQWLDLTSADALIKLTGTRGPTQLAFDNSTPPVEVSWVAGPWLDRFRHDKRVLQFIGDIYKIAAIPGGRPSGAWAKSVGLALNQLWREQAKWAQFGHCGDDNRPTISFDYSFTRYDLLDMFRAQPWAGEILDSSNPHRADRYWREAIKILKRVGMISYCEPKNKLNIPRRRSGWQEAWFQEELDIRPKEQWIKPVLELFKRRHPIKRKYSPKRTSQVLF